MSNPAQAPVYSNSKLHAHLEQLGTIDQSILDTALAQAEETEISLEESLAKHDVIEEVTLGRIIADFINMKHVSLGNTPIPLDVLSLIPEKVAKAQKVVAYKKDDSQLFVATPYPNNELFFTQLHKKTGLQVVPHYTTHACFKQALLLYAKDISESFTDIIAQSVAETKKNPKAQPPIITLVDTILTHANRIGASDVHIEPLESEILVRMRIDGFLHDVVTLPADMMPLVVTRIKVMAKLRTDEHQNSQDGKISFKIVDGSTEEKLDVRVSIAPTTSGEKVVLRLLSENAQSYSFEELGISSQDVPKLKKAAALPNGMILCTGPTGSGKTTTLYSMLSGINKRDINIMTIEDPVEYQIETINQMQVNSKAGLTFAKGLRAIVRQDPDVILVGEIRDAETADIAVNSAMTGHLVLSSVHTNDAATTFPRMIDMEVEPYLLASTVNIVIAQRLVRKICTACKVSTQLDTSNIDSYFQRLSSDHAISHVYHGKGCAVCHDTGYRGRIGIFEILEVTEEIKSAIIAKKSSSEIEALAIEMGMRTMIQDGAEKVKQGITTFDELIRVTKLN